MAIKEIISEGGTKSVKSIKAVKLVWARRKTISCSLTIDCIKLAMKFRYMSLFYEI